MVRPACCDKMNVKRGLWTEEEDARILAHVSKHGTGNWTSVPRKAGLRRCGKSCRLRWTNYLRPDLKHDNFTPQEEELIIRLHSAIGSRWSIIAQQLSGRTDNDVKNYWNTKLRKKLSDMGIDPVTHKPFSQILVDYQNIGGLPKSNNRIGCFSKDLKNAILVKPSSFSNINNTSQSNYQNFDLLDQLQSIKLVTEASSFTNNETLKPNIYADGSLSSSTSSSSSICSTAGKENPSLAFSWQDFLLEDAFLANEPRELEHVMEFSSNNSMNQTQNTTEVAMNQHKVFEENDGTFGIRITQGCSSSSCESKFIEDMIDQENKMLMDFPDLLEEPFYY